MAAQNVDFIVGMQMEPNTIIGASNLKIFPTQ